MLFYIEIKWLTVGGQWPVLRGVGEATFRCRKSSSRAVSNLLRKELRMKLDCVSHLALALNVEPCIRSKNAQDNAVTAIVINSKCIPTHVVLTSTAKMQSNLKGGRTAIRRPVPGAPSRRKGAQNSVQGLNREADTDRFKPSSSQRALFLHGHTPAKPISFLCSFFIY